jgi:predicted nucleic acid-binding Zn ribbon protein
MKLVNYKCEDCSHQEEVLFQDREKVLSALIHYCPVCGGELKKYNFKNNKQVWKFFDNR